MSRVLSTQFRKLLSFVPNLWNVLILIKAVIQILGDVFDFFVTPMVTLVALPLDDPFTDFGDRFGRPIGTLAHAFRVAFVAIRRVVVLHYYGRSSKLQ